MGATVIVGMKAAALRRPNGQVVYFLFEHTYEKNCYPHTPRWSCVAIGSYKDVLKRIFEGAAACEGGSLRGRCRDLLPEHLIRRWQRALRTPLTMPDITVRVEPTLPFSRDDENAHYRENIAVVLSGQGRPDLADTFRAGSAITLGLYADLDLVLALHGQNGPVSPWRAVRVEQAQGPAVPDFAPPRASDPVTPPDFAIWALDENVRVGRVGGEPFEVLGWEYRAVGHFMVRHVYPLELQRTGGARSLIRAFREACTAAPLLPDTARLTVRFGDVPDTHSWQRERATALTTALGVTDGNAVSTTLGEIRRIGGLRDLQSLSPAQLVWDETSITDISPKPVSAP